MDFGKATSIKVMDFPKVHPFKDKGFCSVVGVTEAKTFQSARPYPGLHH